MGTLVVVRCPTGLVANLADHTYVECGTGGRAWRCWGGKSGGTVLRRSAGSTRRANAIARPNERAGVRCYLINGVCHQAANRVLLPAGITVRGARGYGVSEALFGAYGRPRGPFGTCRAPFDQHAGITGDLPGCAEDVASAPLSTPEHRAERKYLSGVLAIYRKAERRLQSAGGPSGPDLEQFLLELFMHKVRFSLGRRLDRSLARKLREIRASTERSRMKLEEWFARRQLTAGAFAAAFNAETILFQEAMAGALKADQYRALFGLRRGESVILADPRIVRRAYRGR
ncbi:MAG: hypothetical protein ACREVS_01050 [Burkholderiales bacterium]